MEEKMTYEQAIKALEETVAKLEKNDTDMDTAFALYEKGVALAKFCEDYLTQKEKSLEESES